MQAQVPEQHQKKTPNKQTTNQTWYDPSVFEQISGQSRVMDQD